MSLLEKAKGLFETFTSPTAIAYGRNLMENLNPFETNTINESILDEEEIGSLRNIVSEKLGKGDTGLSYKDYITRKEGANRLGYNVDLPTITDSRESLRMLLGKADITRDEDGNIYVEDIYDFNPEGEATKEMLDKPSLQRLKFFLEGAGDRSFYGNAHKLGELFGVEGGVPVKLKVGSAKDLGLDNKTLAGIPMLRELQGKEEKQVAEKPAPKKETAKAETYKVKSGDTLSKIARNMGVTVNELALANGIDDPNKIRVGQKIMKPVVTETMVADLLGDPDLKGKGI